MDDLISRKNALDEIHRVYEYEFPTASGAFDEFMTVIIPNILQNLPSIEREQKNGRWIYLDECANAGYYCDQCNKRIVKDGWSKTVKKINFCPNCGARLEWK